MYLQEAGYRTEFAPRRRGRTRESETVEANVITLDMIMPIKDGWQVIEGAQRPRFVKIYRSGSSDHDEKKLGFSMGAVDYFVKR